MLSPICLILFLFHQSAASPKCRRGWKTKVEIPSFRQDQDVAHSSVFFCGRILGCASVTSFNHRLNPDLESGFSVLVLRMFFFFFLRLSHLGFLRQVTLTCGNLLSRTASNGAWRGCGYGRAREPLLEAGCWGPFWYSGTPQSRNKFHLFKIVNTYLSCSVSISLFLTCYVNFVFSLAVLSFSPLTSLFFNYFI